MKKPPVAARPRTVMNGLHARDAGRAMLSWLLAKPHVVAKRTADRADGRAFGNAMAADIGRGCADTRADEAAIHVGRVDVLGAASKTDEAQSKRQDKFFRHLVSSEIRGAAHRSPAAPVPRLRSVTLLTNAGVVAQRTAGRADKGAGRDIAVDRLGDNGAGKGTARSALRVGRDAAAIAVIASRETGDEKSSAGKAQGDRFLHSSLPVLWVRDWTIDPYGNVNIACRVP
ncbi:MAG: hypothetical protein U1E55_07280 [Paracoccus sp. (in: a-proteobacteria)]